MEKIMAFFMAIISFFTMLLNGGKFKVTVYENVSYGTEEVQKVDICIPKTGTKNIGLVLMLHGGSWQRGDKSEAYPVSMLKTDAEENGVMTASMNYTLIKFNDPSISIYNIYDDITAAITVCKEKAAEHGYNLNKVMLRGFSAGGHLALMYAYNNKQASPVKITSVFAESAIGSMFDRNLYYIGGSHWQTAGNGIAWAENLAVLGSNLCGHSYTIDTTNAVINENGDTLGWTETPDTIDENAEYIKTISPAESVKPDSVPTLITHGKQDNIVPFSNIQYLVNSLKANGVKYDFIVSETAGHSIKSDSAAYSKGQDKYKDYIKAYLK